MFTKILIANRGEIACRIIRTARAMGIKTVAVFSDADRAALHVRMADEAVHIGASSPTESYLDVEKILDACKSTGAEAVHPGYGFLSENDTFCRRLGEEGIVFIGPPVESITSMGDKITSKQIAEQAGVNTIPGYDGILEDADQAVEKAAEIGYPVMLKATAGGGGKGMRIARNDQECRDGFERAAGEAKSSFGDGRLLIEKYIEQPRHIEIQVMADQHGNVVYLGERECSLQRRHQKVIEEAPSPFLTPETRQQMGEQAVMLAKAVNYTSAGTVECIVDQEQNFYFLEMNTRLQVEHPITEMVTGCDLVELMIRVAAGQPLPMSQDDIQLKGWAVECRVYAEDPVRDFLPSIGRITVYQPPYEDMETVRVDSGIVEGSEISVYYDPMISKLVTKGKDREEAISAMQEALDEYVIQGVATNINFLSALIAHPRFQRGDLSTGFIDEEFAHGFRDTETRVEDPDIPIVVAGIVHRLYMDRAAKISGQMAGHERRVTDSWVVVIGDVHKPLSVKTFQADCGYRVDYDGRNYRVKTDWQFSQKVFHGTINNHRFCLQVNRQGLGYAILYRGLRINALVMTPRVAELHRIMPITAAVDLSKFLLAPMPGLLVKLAVQAGQEVKAGQELAVIEAMKMENVLRAPADGKIASIGASLGDCLTVDQVILEFA
ncbi:MAG: acetyl/propionyl/methylcrotonyl-CoA carboxylase subunit alpha [Candidatus Electrothrix communis]|nr:acetyl/propionyl/methylcrotonyl-CoA carboxylase subunit alpha [Desulfobulbus sp. US4]WLE96780.1 MAG: acetyl/propionyl/methylcrotonyl-CoA carboxylase subunit alpha [Candidatus Electrothrix communis]